MKTQKEITKYCSNCTAELEDVEHYKKCPKCGRQYFFNAKACAALWLTNDDDEVLLTKRGRDPYKNWWDIPGGFVEEGESIEEAAKRELKEETNIDIDVADLVYLGSVSEEYEYRGEIIPVVAAIFKAKIETKEVTVADDVSDYKFVKKSEVDMSKIAFENQRKFLSKLI